MQTAFLGEYKSFAISHALEQPALIHVVDGLRAIGLDKHLVSLQPSIEVRTIRSLPMHRCFVHDSMSLAPPLDPRIIHAVRFDMMN